VFLVQARWYHHVEDIGADGDPAPL
jgi:hypothetical protein